MSTIIDHAERLRQVADIAEVIGRYVELRRAGTTLKGLCPFHREKTPSFNVQSDRGFFHCFGCGKGGDVIKFLQEIEHIEWIEAVRLLSEQFGLPMPEREGRDAGRAERERSERDQMLALSRMAAEHFHKRLLGEVRKGERSEAARYLESRGLGEDAVEKFQVGLAADGWTDLLEASRRQGYSEEAMLVAGLANRSAEKNRVYDRFRNRIVFPIHDSLGRPIAFGARVFAADAGADEPKYINSPETPLYTKGQQLYALHLAKEAMSKSRRAILMEGYLDVIRAHLAGFPEAVASCGTALTDEQARQLRRHADTVVFAYDGDEAGQKAMQRGTEILLGHGFVVRVLALPGGHDPDSFLREYGGETFGRALDGARSWLEVFLGAAGRRHGLDSPDAKARAADEVLPLLRRIGNPVAAAESVRRTAEFLDVEEGAVARLVQRAVAKAAVVSRAAANSDAAPATAEVVDVPTPLPQLRDRFLILMAIESAYARAAIGDEQILDFIENEQVRRVLAAVLESKAAKGESAISYGGLSAQLPTEADQALLRALQLIEEPVDDSPRAVSMLLARVKRGGIHHLSKQVNRTISRAPGSTTDPDEDWDGSEYRKSATGLAVAEIDRISHLVPKLKNLVLRTTESPEK